MKKKLIAPHGGSLSNLMVSDEEASKLITESKDWSSWVLNQRQLCDLELLLNGAFSPLKGFMNRRDYESVLQSMRLSNGEIWPIPIVLDAYEELVRKIGIGSYIALRDQEGILIATLRVEDIWQPDRLVEAEQIYGTTNCEHSGVHYLINRMNSWYIGGTIKGVNQPVHYDFRYLRLSPHEMREDLLRSKWNKIVAFQTRNPLHRVHQEITLRAARELDAKILLHPVIGMTKPGDLDHFTRVRCYQALIPHYPEGSVKLGLLPLSMRLAGPKEAVWHAIIRKNFGCSHFIIGRDHASPGCDSMGKPYYEPYEAHALFNEHENELGIKAVLFKELHYVEDLDQYVPYDEVPENTQISLLSGTELRRRLKEGEEIPTWFTFAEVVEELRKTYPPRHKQGFTIFFTGLPSSGKSTTANILAIKLLEMGGRPVTLLDGDVVRKYLSSELGYSKVDRDINIRRIGYVASEITKNGGIAICAPIAPYESTREEVRSMIEHYGGFILVYVATPQDVCEKRDRKGLYAKARAGIIRDFTGISDPFESPNNPNIILDTTNISSEECVQSIIEYLINNQYIDYNERN